MEGLCFYSSKYRVTKGFKFHAQPQTGAYSCSGIRTAPVNHAQGLKLHAQPCMTGTYPCNLLTLKLAFHFLSHPTHTIPVIKLLMNSRVSC